MAAQGLNVLMVTARYFPFMGGIQTHVHEVGRRLVRNGVNVTLLTTVSRQPESPLPREDNVEGMRVLRVPAWPQQRDYYFAPEIYSIIKKGKWDLIHCQGCHTFVPPLAMQAAREAHIPYILTFHTGGHSSGFRNSIRGMQWKMLRPLLLHATRLIGVSRFEADYFRTMLHLPQQQFVVIPNGTARLELPAERVPETGRLLITSVGRLEKYKGHQRIIRAMPAILQQRPDAHLLILGTGPYEPVLHELIHHLGITNQVEIRSVPAHDRQGMAKLLAQSALVTLLSEYEAHPIAVMEALALQRPVLLTDTSGLSEIAEQGYARTVPLHSTPDEIAGAVLKQLEDPLIPPAAFTLPTWEDCTRQLQDVYSAVVEKRELCVY